jgi:SAM-dependent methyltransferase
MAVDGPGGWGGGMIAARNYGWSMTTSRCRVPELMDDAGLDRGLHASALEGLGRINWVSRSDAILWPELARLAASVGGGPVSVLDLASGGGDVAIALGRRARRAGIDVKIRGCDISDEAVRFATREAQRRGVGVEFRQLDALRDPIPEGFDVLTCSLFLHHLDDAEAILLLERMRAAAGRLVLINDLARTRVGYWLAWAGCRVLSRSPIVRHDGPVSAAAAFSIDEARGLAERAGLEGARITRHWPSRFLLSWSRPS